MSNTAWQVSGEYFETCSCDFLCPCIPTNMAGQPTKGHCDFAMVFHVEKGQHGNTKLDGLNFVAIGHSPDVMGLGNMSVGLVIDERATPAQRDALTAIGSGQGGGPMAALGPLITKMLGIEFKPIHFDKKNMGRSVSIPGVLDEAVEGVASASKPGEPIYIDNSVHPAQPSCRAGEGDTQSPARLRH